MIFLTSYGFSQQMKVEIEGNITFDESGLTISEAGENFPSLIKSEYPVLLSVLSNDFWNKKGHSNKKWSIYLHKSDVIWNDELRLRARRTGNGHKPNNPGEPNINDGDQFQRITNNPKYFIRGKSEIIDIPISLRIRGISITMGAQDFETNIVFTVYDNW